MKNPIGIILIIVGVALLIFGYNASESIASSFSRFFNGTPTDKSIWLIIGGVVALVVGAAFSWRSSRS